MILQIFAVVVCLAFFVYIVLMIKREQLLVRYSLLWFVLGLVIIVCAIFPEPVYALARWLGFEAPSNFIFFIGLFLLIAITLSLTAIVSMQTIRIKNLTQELALLKHEEEHRGK